MPESSAKLLSDLRATIEHQRDAFGSIVFQESSERTDRKVEFETLSSPEGASPVVRDTVAGVTLVGVTLVGGAVVEDTVAGGTVSEKNLFHEPANVTMSPTERTPYARIEALIPTGSPLHRLTTLEEVADYVASSVLIPLDEERTNPVFGVGNPQADLMVIGEAPGADEDRQGEPFVGRAGQLLTKILLAIGFERSDVYIANILKSRPPKNRDPLPAEVEAHIPILYKQIALIQPKLMLCVGRTAGTSLLKQQTSLANLRGSFHDFNGLPVLVTYHPAALLRNPNWKRPTWEDVQLLRARYDELGGS